MGDRRGTHRVLVVIPRRKWNDNIKMDLQGVEWGSMGLTDKAQDRNRWWAVVIAVMNLLAP
jgi:hypothetical protein